ncbi:MAG TPA: peptidyl-prolyl cis-trans isomerase [Bryocella sp.]|nr:peptidyl-prolyl cis-trans isomerase [Bryocella sp.]
MLKVGEVQITQALFEQYVADLESQQGPATATRKKLGENYASMLALSEQAKADELENSPEVQRLLAIDRIQILSNAEFAKLKAEATPTPEQIKAYYNAHGADFDVVLVKRVFIWAGKPDANNHTLTPEKAKAMAEAVRHAYKTGGDVDKVVRDTPHGVDDVVADEKPLRFRSGEMPAVMNKAVFGLKEGEWTEFTNESGEYAFVHVVKREREDLHDVTPEITKKLLAENLREKLLALKSKTGIWMDETYFASASSTPAANTQPETSGQGKTSTERGDK